LIVDVLLVAKIIDWIKAIRIFPRQVVDFLLDLVKVVLVEKLPSKLFLTLYSARLLNRSRLDDYQLPYFSNKKFLNMNAEFIGTSVIEKSRQLLISDYKDKNNTPGNLLLVSKYKNATFGLKNVLMVIPVGWLNPESDAGRTWSAKIQFLINGLEALNFKCDVIEIAKSYHDFSNLDNMLENYDLIFIFSLTIINPNDKFFKYLVCYPGTESIRKKIIGVITGSPSPHRIEIYRKWNTVLDTVLYYEENSDYREQLDQLFTVVHLPFPKLISDSISLTNPFTPSIHASCLIKQNRIAWLLILRYQCIVLDVKYFIRAISIPLSVRKIRDTYLPNDFIDLQRTNFGFGFAMLHRSNLVDAHLIGPFWDNYSLGVIPLVQMQQEKSLATYMTPYLDYFPIISDLDLFVVLKLSRDFPEHFQKLKDRIVKRMKTDFAPEVVVAKLLFDLKIE
jgi:hypothetical protein